MGRRGYRQREQVTEVQVEGPSRRETGTASRTGEEASSKERAVATGKEECCRHCMLVAIFHLTQKLHVHVVAKLPESDLLILSPVCVNL